MGRNVLEMIVEGHVKVNGKRGDVHQPLRTGDYLEVDTARCKRPAEKADPKGLEILYRDEGTLCVFKPAGIPVIPDRRPKGSTAVEICRKMLAPEGLRPKPVHRLDKHTSGVLMLALTKEYVHPLGELFADRLVDKVYLAFVRGTPRPAEGEIDLPIGADRKKATRMVIDRARGKPALSFFKTIKTWNGYSLVEVRPKTGRTHQVRVHMAHIKHPILCDALYGGGDAFHLSTIKPNYRIGRGRRERPILNRQALHAAQLSFRSPATGKEVVVKAPLSEDLVILQGKLEKFA